MGRPGPVVRPLGAHDPARLGPHRLVGRLGSGGMGTVYLARPRFGSPVAVKAVHPELADEPEFRSRFAREVATLSRVRSPFVPAFAGADPQAEVPWLATAYVDGPTLREQVERVGPLRGAALTGLAAGMASALADIHAAGIVHRDLKPSNVILSPDGPRVLDFGIARTLDGTAHPGLAGVMGTPGWIAPERFRGAPATAASDVFAWGQLTAYAATGRNPFGPGSSETAVRRVLRGEAALDGVPPELLSLVRASVSPLPGYRPAPHEILRALGDGRGLPAAGAVALRVTRNGCSSPGPVVGGAPRHRRVLRRGAAALTVAVVVTAGAVVGVRHGGAEPERIGMSGVGGAGDVAPRAGDWPPPEATDTATGAGRRSVVVLGSGGPGGRSHRAEFTLGAPGGSIIRVSPPERSPSGALVLHGEVVAPEAGDAYGISEERFSVLTEGGEYSPSRVRTEGADDAGVRFSVGFEGAPATGLLVVHGSDRGGEVDEAPSVGVCYSVSDAEFSVDYARCT
ncbi:serine/threonine-protein kinase [Nocardiopsis eucommiae]|uniref:serine/threonine-protein kinase n=1 Tax=Nocardiopsis eucommiae TaxID=2831970 RepID=UPI003D7232A7